MDMGVIKPKRMESTFQPETGSAPSSVEESRAVSSRVEIKGPDVKVTPIVATPNNVQQATIAKPSSEDQVVYDKVKSMVSSGFEWVKETIVHTVKYWALVFKQLELEPVPVESEK